MIRAFCNKCGFIGEVGDDGHHLIPYTAQRCNYWPVQIGDGPVPESTEGTLAQPDLEQLDLAMDYDYGGEG